MEGKVGLDIEHFTNAGFLSLPSGVPERWFSDTV